MDTKRGRPTDKAANRERAVREPMSIRIPPRDPRPSVDDVSEMSFPASDPPAVWTWDPPEPSIVNSPPRR
jgi:hypothetical protein